MKVICHQTDGNEHFNTLFVGEFFCSLLISVWNQIFIEIFVIRDGSATSVIDIKHIEIEFATNIYTFYMTTDV